MAEAIEGLGGSSWMPPPQCAAHRLMRLYVQIGLRVVEEISREYRRAQISERVGQLLIAPADMLSSR
jgi:hypothetical protein